MLFLLNFLSRSVSFLLFFSFLAQVAAHDTHSPTHSDLADHTLSLAQKHLLPHAQLEERRTRYIPPVCYTKTVFKNLHSNPCYTCHKAGKIPNYYNDSNLQLQYHFPLNAMKNPYTNLFKEYRNAVANISDKSIIHYIQKDNYHTPNGTILLAEKLSKKWQGYRPDAYFHFDTEGFDRDPKGGYTLWRAFRYTPFPGSFWPTNGSTDDVLIRLDPRFSQDKQGNFNLEIYKLNLAIIESLIKQKNIPLDFIVDEKRYGIDLNHDNRLQQCRTIIFSSQQAPLYVGRAYQALKKGRIHLAPGLYPEGTEFLHSVRYIDWDMKASQIRLAPRMKELRYAKKIAWKSYSKLARMADAEFQEAIINGDDTPDTALFSGSSEQGLRNELGWRYQGFIENSSGDLRPQTTTETLSCMGCHTHLGATFDTTFAFHRKLEGIKKALPNYGWGHWSQQSLKGVKEPIVTTQDDKKVYEYSFYLKQTHSGDPFESNKALKARFFETNGTIKKAMLDLLHQDISILLFPSYKSAMQLNKAYRAIVKEQSFIYGKVPHTFAIKNSYKKLSPHQSTKLKTPINTFN